MEFELALASWDLPGGIECSYFTNDFGSIPQIFTRESMRASKSMLSEEPCVPRQLAQSEIMKGNSLDDMPFLLGYVGQGKDRATIALVSDYGDPVLASSLDRRRRLARPRRHLGVRRRARADAEGHVVVAEVATHLATNVIPNLPARQWERALDPEHGGEQRRNGERLGAEGQRALRRESPDADQRHRHCERLAGDRGQRGSRGGDALIELAIGGERGLSPRAHSPRSSPWLFRRQETVHVAKDDPLVLSRPVRVSVDELVEHPSRAAVRVAERLSKALDFELKDLPREVERQTGAIALPD
jgi:hypothetical protein